MLARLEANAVADLLRKDQAGMAACGGRFGPPLGSPLQLASAWQAAQAWAAIRSVPLGCLNDAHGPRLRSSSGPLFGEVDSRTAAQAAAAAKRRHGVTSANQLGLRNTSLAQPPERFWILLLAKKFPRICCWPYRASDLGKLPVSCAILLDGQALPSGSGSTGRELV